MPVTSFNITALGFQLVAVHSLWLLPLCFLLGAAFTLVLYYRNTAEDFPRRLVWLLSVFRFVSASLVAFLLLSPMVKTLVRTTEKPTIVIGIDNSASLLLSPDSTFIRDSLLKEIDKLSESLGDAYEVVRVAFGEQTTSADSIDFSDNLTDISAFYDQINNRFYNRNLGAVIMATDGIYNTGSDPVYSVRNVNYPVFTINLGDTNLHRDLSVRKINYNRVAFRGNRFPVEILVHALEARGETSQIKVEHKGNIVFSQQLNFISDNQIITVPVMIQAEESGQQRYRITIGALQDESNLSNNSRDIFVNVRENKQKIAIIANAPHPDLAAIERSIGNSNNFETRLFFAENFNEKIPDYSLYILHQLPSATNSMIGLTTELARQNIPVLFILGNQSDIVRFNSLNTGLQLTDYNGSVNEALPGFNPLFPLFITSPELKSLLQKVPPLQSPFARYKLNNSAFVYAYQTIGTLSTKMPLIFFTQTPDRRGGVIAGEGLWKWRLTDFVHNNTHIAFDELIGKMVQYLSVETEKSRFRVSWRNYYAENENIEFGATLFNDSYELINDKPVSMSITGEDKQRYEFDFSASGESYQLNIGNFTPGIYVFDARVETGSEVLSQTGSFTVTALNLEDLNTIANHRLLNTISSLTGGSSVYPEYIDKLSDQIKSRSDVKPVTYARKRFTDLINFYPLMILIILMMGVEWFLRKFNGSY